MPKTKSSLSVGLCPCGSGRRFADCCGLYLSGGSQALGAPTPEALMRSRYSAYACGDDAYVLATWAPETRPS
ncbi:YchJ family protein, partial [Sutterella wadsworthensis]